MTSRKVRRAPGYNSIADLIPSAAGTFFRLQKPANSRIRPAIVSQPRLLVREGAR